MSYSVSMENAATHYYHVVLHCKKIAGETQDFKMCAWTPGYYQIIDFAKAVENFHATDAAGKDIQWEKSSANTARWACAPIRSTKRGNMGSNSPIWRRVFSPYPFIAASISPILRWSMLTA